METPHRLFTRDEANALLPQLEPLVAELRRAAAAARAVLPEIEAVALRSALTGGTQPTGDERAARRSFGEAQERVGEALRTLEELGVWVKDIERGLLDFPSERDGEVVELCWLHGEPSVDHWHRIGEGFAGRKPLDG